MRQALENMLEQLNELLGTQMALDYAPQYGGYLLSAVPRQFAYFKSRLDIRHLKWLSS